MDLYILRHAIAVQRGTKGFEQDSERPLTEKGIKKMRRIARGMAALGLSFDLILSSPFLRARQTAEIVTDVGGSKEKLELCPFLETGGDPEALIRDLASREEALASVLLVGHEPYLSELVSVLIAGDAGAGIMLKKGGLCMLSAESLRFGRCATLEWLLTPSQLEKLR